jgi:DNA modification methylase
MQAYALGLPDPTVADIAVEVRGSSIGSAHTATRNDLILSKHLHNPEVARAKTAKEAMLVLKRVEQAEFHRKLADMQGDTLTTRGHTCVNADSFVWCANQSDSLFDVIITDPPYGIGADTFGESQDGTTSAHGYRDDADCVTEILGWFPLESFRLTKAQAHLYIFLDFDYFHLWKMSLESAGWKVFRTPLIWHRPTGFRTPWINSGPQRKYEMVLYAVKGEKHVNMIAPDVITLQSAGEGLGHPAAKPAAIYTELLRRSVKPGDSVFDPFAGTGPVFGAATELKCNATGVEIDSTFYGISLSQITKGKEIV